MHVRKMTKNFFAAVEGGHLEMLKWAVNNRCTISEKTLAIVQERGNVEILQFVREKLKLT
jgi:hypothetical protein